MTRVQVNPRLLKWALERAQLDPLVVEKRFPKLQAWAERRMQPTLRQLEDFARATHVPIGYLFLQEPPVETVPIPDFRTRENAGVRRPSPDLLETVYLCQQRQEWFHDFARSAGEEVLLFVGSLTVESDVTAAAASIRDTLRFDVERRRALPTWSEALREFVAMADEAGILVMSSGIVGSNTHRKLDAEEFRGFAMADPLAPVVFINGADSRSAQMFTLAHELAHIWLGQSAVSDAQARSVPAHRVERWCNQVAAELLVPLDLVRREFRAPVDLEGETNRLARRFKVSTLVVLRRIYDAGGLTREAFWRAYDAEVERLRALPAGAGGNFYLSVPVRVSRRFARALVASTLEGQTLYRDALRMLGFSKMKTFDELGRKLGVAA
jgi:Zn-dependent peptidase ImmA (M78 family)